MAMLRKGEAFETTKHNRTGMTYIGVVEKVSLYIYILYIPYMECLGIMLFFVLFAFFINILFVVFLVNWCYSACSCSCSCSCCCCCWTSSNLSKTASPEPARQALDASVLFRSMRIRSDPWASSEVPLTRPLSHVLPPRPVQRASARRPGPAVVESRGTGNRPAWSGGATSGGSEFGVHTSDHLSRMKRLRTCSDSSPAGL